MTFAASRAILPAWSPLVTRSGVTIATSEGRPSSSAASTTTALDSFSFSQSPISRSASTLDAETFAESTETPSTSRLDSRRLSADCSASRR